MSNQSNDDNSSWTNDNDNEYHGAQSCDTVSRGYQCEIHISHYWGQYSPFFSVSSSISTAIPPECSVSFAQVLSRHGARQPTTLKTLMYNATISRIQAAVHEFHGKYAFLKSFKYTLGADQLSVFGQRQLSNSGENFFDRYRDLTQKYEPFVRSTGQTRILDSARNWTRGFNDAKGQQNADTMPSVIIPEDIKNNNTLSHGLCTAMEHGPISEIGAYAQTKWKSIWVPPIQQRLNQDLPGADLTVNEVIYLMDLCPFITVDDERGKLSNFCYIFTTQEWRQYDYYQSLGKYYGYGAGNPLGPTAGVGWVNELIARLTNSPVHDHTSTNSTLDSNPATFPTGGVHRLFADFSHDNDMTSIFAALGLYNATAPLSNTTIVPARQAAGYAASWTVPFAARMYVEKLQCQGEKDEFVRILVNDRVVPLDYCGGDELGRCRLEKFVESLSFARQGGNWDSCFS